MQKTSFFTLMIILNTLLIILGVALNVQTQSIQSFVICKMIYKLNNHYYYIIAMRIQ